MVRTAEALEATNRIEVQHHEVATTVLLEAEAQEVQAAIEAQEAAQEAQAVIEVQVVLQDHIAVAQDLQEADQAEEDNKLLHGKP